MNKSSLQRKMNYICQVLDIEKTNDVQVILDELVKKGVVKKTDIYVS